MNATVTVQHRGEKRPRTHNLYNTSNGSVFYFHKNKATNERQKKYVTNEWFKQNNTPATSTSSNNNTNLTNKDMQLLRTYYGFDYNMSLRNDIVRGYKKDKSQFATMYAFEKNLRGGVPKKRSRPSWMPPATVTNNKPNNNWMWYNANGQRINRNEQESQLY
jgi:hypothetical protein